MYQTEHDSWFASIASGKPINNGEYRRLQHAAGYHGPMASYTVKTPHLGVALPRRKTSATLPYAGATPGNAPSRAPE